MNAICKRLPDLQQISRFERQVPGAQVPGVECACSRSHVCMFQESGTMCQVPGARDQVARDHVSDFRDQMPQ